MYNWNSYQINTYAVWGATMNIIWVLRGVKLGAFTPALFALLFAFNARSATPDARACFTEGPGAQGDLEDGQSNVLSRRGKFDYERMQYHFEALSLWGFEGPKP